MVSVKNQIAKNHLIQGSLQCTIVYIAVVCAGKYIEDNLFEGFCLDNFKDLSN